MLLTIFTVITREPRDILNEVIINLDRQAAGGIERERFDIEEDNRCE